MTDRLSKPSGALLAVLTLLVAFGPLSTDLYLPSLPGLATRFDSDVATVQLTLSVFLLAFATAQLFYGPLSDRFGRRPVALTGIAIFLVASLGCALATSIEALIAARALQAIGACAGPVLGRAIVRDLFERDQAASVLATMALAMSIAPAIGPILGGFLETHLGWQSSFILLAIIGAVAFAGFFATIPESNRFRDRNALAPSQLIGRYRQLLGDRRYIGYVVVCGCGYGGLFCFISGSAPTFMTGFGVGPQTYGFLFAFIVVGFAIGAYLASRLTLRIGGDRMIGFGTLSASAGGLIMTGVAWIDPTGASSFGPFGLVTPMLLVSGAAGLIMPNAMAGAAAPFPKMAGAASALLGFAQMGFAALAGLAVAAAFDGTGRSMATGIAVITLTGAVAFRLMINPHITR